MFNVNMFTLAQKFNTEAVAVRRSSILEAARWCFLNFGFSKTSLDDIAKRANISRTLLYRTFKDKEEIFTAVFAHWLVARHPEAQRVAASSGSAYERLLGVCRLMVLEPWSDMVGAPMAGEFYDVCARLDPDIDAHHRDVALQCVATILGSEESAEVFLLALNGLLGDEPTSEVLEQRTRLLAARFVTPTKKKGRRPGTTPAGSRAPRRRS
jgi:AcrR family transcriptional regulator